MHMDWPYYTLENGKLVDEAGNIDFPEKTFNSAAEAEKFLEDNDYRGSVR